MAKKKERNSEGKSAVVIAAGIIVTSICGDLNPERAALYITAIGLGYMAIRAYIKSTPSQRDDEILARIEKVCERVLKDLKKESIQQTRQYEMF